MGVVFSILSHRFVSLLFVSSKEYSSSMFSRLSVFMYSRLFFARDNVTENIFLIISSSSASFPVVIVFIVQLSFVCSIISNSMSVEAIFFCIRFRVSEFWNFIFISSYPFLCMNASIGHTISLSIPLRSTSAFSGSFFIWVVDISSFSLFSSITSSSPFFMLFFCVHFLGSETTCVNFPIWITFLLIIF